MVAPAYLHEPDRVARAWTLSRRFFEHASAVRYARATRYGRARVARRAYHGRPGAAFTGQQRKPHRTHYAAGERRAGHAHYFRPRPSRAAGSAYRGREARLRCHGSASSCLDRIHLRRFAQQRRRSAIQTSGWPQGDGSAIEGGTSMSDTIRPQHFGWKADGKVATITLNRPEKKKPLTFGSYGELVDTFRRLARMAEIKVVVITGAGENFSSGGDVHEIIGPLVGMRELEQHDKLLAFTRMTGSLVKAMRACPQPIIAAVDGVCAGAGAILAMASDLRIGTPRSKVAFLFVRVGLSGADMGACAMLPRIIGQGRAAELLYTGRFMTSDEASSWGFFNKVVAADALLDEARALARSLADGPAIAHATTKQCLHLEWNMGVDAAVAAE